MAATINVPAYSDALVVLGTAGIVVPLVRRYGFSPILGYLGAGALLGPLGLGSFIEQVPLLYWLTVVDAKNVGGIADLGVVFLLFLIGLELSPERLMAMRRLVFGLGGSQVLVTTLMLACAAALAGQPAAAAVIIGASLALSSTAIVLEVLSEQGRLTTTAGRASFSVLLAQDLAVVPLLMLVSLLGANSKGSVMSSVVVALLQGAFAIAVIVLVGRVLLRPLYRLVAQTRSSELFIAVTLFVIVASGVVAALAGLSMALGAFVAGLLLTETEYKKAIEGTVEPFKGLLLGIFFFTVGMAIDVREVIRDPLLMLAAVVALVALKALVMYVLARHVFKLAVMPSLETALLIGPGGEFAFVGIGLAAALGLVAKEAASFTLALTALTMALIPLLAAAARRIAPRLDVRKPLDPVLAAVPGQMTKHAIVVGHGRVGHVVTKLLREHGVPYVATDHDADTVAADRKQGHAVFFGDASQPAFLKACGLADAAAVIVTMHTRSTIDEVVQQVRQQRPDILIVSRALDAEHARHLYEVGVTDAVPETVEASLQLSEAALVGIGIPTGRVIASIHEERDIVRRALQTAAREAGREGRHSMRSKGAAG